MRNELQNKEQGSNFNKIIIPDEIKSASQKVILFTNSWFRINLKVVRLSAKKYFQNYFSILNCSRLQVNMNHLTKIYFGFKIMAEKHKLSSQPKS